MSLAKTAKTQHPISQVGSLLLFFVYVLLMLPVLITSAGAYHASVDGKSVNDNLYTGVGYLTTTFRQYDRGDSIKLCSYAGGQALCFTETIEESSYHTYLYLLNGELKELFTMEGYTPDPGMGTTIADLAAFTIEQPQDDYLLITMEDQHAQSSTLLLHLGVSEIGEGKRTEVAE